MVRLRAEAVIGPTGIEADIQLRLEAHRERLAHYRKLEDKDFSAQDMSYELQVRHLILSAGIMLETHWVQWSE